MKQKKIILGVSGSIAAYKAGDIIRRLREESFAVSVIMTKEAEAFITSLTLATLSGGRVYRDMFAGREYSDIESIRLGSASLTTSRSGFDPESNRRIEHISLADEASLILIAPATANVIAKIAAGICDDLLTTTVCASTSKVLIAPAMNENMYHNKIVKENIVKLEKIEYKFIPPRKGKLACGKTGEGCLAAVEDIIKAVKNEIKKNGR